MSTNKKLYTRHHYHHHHRHRAAIPQYCIQNQLMSHKEKRIIKTIKVNAKEMNLMNRKKKSFSWKIYYEKKNVLI